MVQETCHRGIRLHVRAVHCDLDDAACLELCLGTRRTCLKGSSLSRATDARGVPDCSGRASVVVANRRHRSRQVKLACT